MSKKVPIKKLLRESDAFLSTSERIYDFYLKNRKKVIYGALGLVLITIIIAVFFSVRASWVEKSSAAYYEAISDDPETNLANMAKVREEWEGYPAERLAAFSMVQSYKSLGKIAEARDLLRNLALRPKKGEESLAVLIHSYLGALSEEMKDYEEALSNYQKAKVIAETRVKGPGGEVIANSEVMDQTAAPFISNLLLGIGRTSLSLGNKDAAKEAYAELSRSFPDTMGSFMAELKLDEIDKLSSASPPEPEEALGSGPEPSDTGDDALAIEEENILGDAPAAGETDEAKEAEDQEKAADDKAEDKAGDKTDDKAADKTDDKAAAGKDKKDADKADSAKDDAAKGGSANKKK
jgi:tetratricopeptide (TPR) repeat protein